MKRLLVGLSVLVLTTAVRIPLHADNEVRIIHGTLSQTRDSTGYLNIEGTSGVRIDATLDAHFAGIAWDYVCPYRACLPGEVITLGAVYGTGVFTGSGEVTLRGQTYSLWTGSELDAAFQLSGSFVLPEFTDDVTAVVSAPFTCSGFVQVPSRIAPPTNEVFELVGSGVATVLLVNDPYIGGWVVVNVTYEFMPTRT
jgi:hypothetical protein